MKTIYKTPLTLLVLLTSLLLTDLVQAVTLPTLDKSPADISAFPTKGPDKVVKVIYSRPQAQGRKVFGELVKYDKVWRTGANEATEVTFFTDVTIDGTKVRKGTYTLFTIPTANSWTVILNKELNQWGAYTYNKEADVLRTTVKSKTQKENVHSFSIAFDEKNKNKVEMILAWENTTVNLPIKY